MKKDAKILLAKLLEQELRDTLGLSCYCKAVTQKDAPAITTTYNNLLELALHMFALGKAWTD